MTDQPRTTDNGPIKPAEMWELFGDEMPLEAVRLIWEAPPGKTVGEVRRQLRQLAADYRAGLLEHEKMP